VDKENWLWYGNDVTERYNVRMSDLKEIGDDEVLYALPR